jgi:hypothetical protein
LVTPSGERIPLKLERAEEPASGLQRRLKVATTSSAVIGCPVLNLTF